MGADSGLSSVPPSVWGLWCGSLPQERGIVVGGLMVHAPGPCGRKARGGCGFPAVSGPGVTTEEDTTESAVDRLHLPSTLRLAAGPSSESVLFSL